eukprot:m.80988 g.80988  ORF g.80988 m.80988 type:complete len:211 (-) comp12620_c0_seq6:2919-3551(-)
MRLKKMNRTNTTLIMLSSGIIFVLCNTDLDAFSVPTEYALQTVQALPCRRLMSCGGGAGYWEALLLSRGMNVVVFDRNDSYPEEMRHTYVITANEQYVSDEGDVNDALMLAWPDAMPDSLFGFECVKRFKGSWIVHVGELFGESITGNPWGQSTSQACQVQLAKDFRVVKRVSLPQWPHQRDSLTIWSRVSKPVECDGAVFHYVSPFPSP